MPNEQGSVKRNRYNASIVQRASTLTILLTAGLTYWLTGWFGAALVRRRGLLACLLQSAGPLRLAARQL